MNEIKISEAGQFCRLGLTMDFFLCCIKGVLKKIIEAATAETTARTLCQLGDNLIEEETGKVYKKEKELKKGKVATFDVDLLSLSFGVNNEGGAGKIAQSDY